MYSSLFRDSIKTDVHLSDKRCFCCVTCSYKSLPQVVQSVIGEADMAPLTSVAVVLLLLVSAYFDAATASAQQYQKDKETCAKLLRTPAEDLEKYRRSEYGENHETFCYVRCIAVLQGHYDDEQGLLVDNLFEVANLGKSREEFGELLAGCQAQVGEDVSCYCHKAFIPLMCFRKHYHEWKKTVASGEHV